MEGIIIHAWECDNGYLEAKKITLNIDKHTDKDGIVAQSGYMQVELEEHYYSITIFDCDGDVLSTTEVPFKFIAVEVDDE
jgi:hypothetical protein